MPINLKSALGGAVVLTPSSTAADVTITFPAVTGTAAILQQTQSYTKGQSGTVSALTYASTVTPDLATSNNFSVTLTGNVILANPTNIVPGQSGVIVITQDATGSRTISFGTYWKFSNATVPVLTTTANAVDYLTYYVADSTKILGSLIKNVS
jgi:hypothetical protein